MLMESPACLLPIAIVLLFVDDPGVVWVFVLLWECHYLYRAFIYPFSLKPRKSMPLSVVAMAVVFNGLNGYLIAGHFVLNPAQYDIDWLMSPQFIVGASLFFSGMVLTRQADKTLKSLGEERRGQGEESYGVPVGGFYRWVSCPNYLGETIQWAGWALLTWSPAGVVFLVWTIANLLPRAISHHQWYQRTFDDYPKGRKALIPFVL